jgi:hypothetical protein
MSNPAPDETLALTGKMAGIEMGPKLAALPERERLFAFSFGSGLATTPGAAAELAGYCKGYAGQSKTKYAASLRSMGHQLVHRPRIIAAIEEVARSTFRSMIPLVVESARQLLLDKGHSDHQKMVVALLSRMGFAEKTQVDVNVEITVDHQEAAIADLRRLKSLGVPRDELERAFGYSGLPRFEKLLAEQDARRLKLVEHVPANAAETSTDTLVGEAEQKEKVDV